MGNQWGNLVGAGCPPKSGATLGQTDWAASAMDYCWISTKQHHPKEKQKIRTLLDTDFRVFKKNLISGYITWEVDGCCLLSAIVRFLTSSLLNQHTLKVTITCHARTRGLMTRVGTRIHHWEKYPEWKSDQHKQNQRIILGFEKKTVQLQFDIPKCDLEKKSVDVRALSFIPKCVACFEPDRSVCLNVNKSNKQRNRN